MVVHDFENSSSIELVFKNKKECSESKKYLERVKIRKNQRDKECVTKYFEVL